MTTVLETVPEALQGEVDAALAWYRRQRGEEFEVTGIVDPDLEPDAAQASRELRLVLCGGDTCEQRTFRVARAGDGFAVSLVEAEDLGAGSPPAELDPPPGARRSWLDAQLAKHAFVVLVFYRGFW